LTIAPGISAFERNVHIADSAQELAFEFANAVRLAPPTKFAIDSHSAGLKDYTIAINYKSHLLLRYVRRMSVLGGHWPRQAAESVTEETLGFAGIRHAQRTKDPLRG
jgi:hypothetical protein